MAKRITTPNTAIYETLLRETAPVQSHSLLSGRKAFASLQENTKYQVVVKGFTETPATQANDKVLGFISFKIEVIADGHPITDTRSVPQGTDIFARQLVEQLGNANLNGVDQEALFNSIIAEETPLDMWVTKREVDSQWYTNYTFQAPVPPAPAVPTTPPAVDTEAFH